MWINNGHSWVSYLSTTTTLQRWTAWIEKISLFFCTLYTTLPSAAVEDWSLFRGLLGTYPILLSVCVYDEENHVVRGPSRFPTAVKCLFISLSDPVRYRDTWQMLVFIRNTYPTPRWWISTHTHTHTFPPIHEVSLRVLNKHVRRQHIWRFV